ncbi:hypothetical protein F5J12DRAFT_907713 [Pisolithus orientalis]|uniref:uncharacterized protein n=1 Tax=Pisolithus orientalis TaxID=936130 RepID=UPI00222513FE|nr:uncharacterized protein F5J12DRAFT_907713 [Pisolithus orientalis]KAI5988123.1 hypothetical protein F5J12DRAFT_907713 [Pisolithus orientalis]
MLSNVDDVAHCISQWGDKLWSFVPLNIPVYATSARMSPSVLAEVCHILHISSAKSFYLNLGNHWINVTQECKIIPNITNISTLDFVCEGMESSNDLLHTLIFINKVLDILQHFQGGQTRVLIVMEISGMVSSRPLVCCCPLTIWQQHAGHVGQSSHVQVWAILLVKSSALQCVSSNEVEIVDGKNNEEEDMAYHKKVEPALHEWVET